jgi:hypothetical protein
VSALLLVVLDVVCGRDGIDDQAGSPLEQPSDRIESASAAPRHPPEIEVGHRAIAGSPPDVEGHRHQSVRDEIIDEQWSAQHDPAPNGGDRDECISAAARLPVDEHVDDGLRTMLRGGDGTNPVRRRSRRKIFSSRNRNISEPSEHRDFVVARPGVTIL